MTEEKKVSRLNYLRSQVEEIDWNEQFLTAATKLRRINVERVYQNAVNKFARRRDKIKAEIFKLENR